MAWEQSLEAFAFRRGSSHNSSLVNPTAANKSDPKFPQKMEDLAAALKLMKEGQSLLD